MNSLKPDLRVLKNKFRGSMLGVLVGDCMGSVFEFEEVTAGLKLVLQQCFDKLEGPTFKAPVKQYSDDAAMTYSLAMSLVENKKFDELDLAKKFVTSYYNEPDRGYAGVITIFQKLRGNKFQDLYGPAREQYNGLGSWGNGAAMRVSPVALFCYNDYNNLLDIARKQSLLTHTHKLGVDGAILQALAVHQALHLNPEEKPLNPIEFVDELIEKMKFIEVDDEGLDLIEPQPYGKQLKVMKAFLSTDEDINDEKIINELGNGSDISAIHSVPTSIYCFLKTVKPIDGIKTDSHLRRSIQYAISLGGDADTIASMTGAISGAYYGEDRFSTNLLNYCENVSGFRKIGDDLAEIVYSEYK